MPKIEKDLLKVKGSDGQWHYVPAVGGSADTAPTWDSVQNKPFSTLGSGLSVDENGVLSAQGGSGGSTNAVQYVAQTLTDEQKKQARANIGASPIPKVRYWLNLNADNIINLYNMGVGYGIISPVDNDQTVPTGMSSPMLVIFGRMNYGIVDITVYDGAGDVWSGSLNLSSQTTDVTKTGDYVTNTALTDILQGYVTDAELEGFLQQTGQVLNQKLDKNQGAGNAGKILGIGADGIVVPQDKTTYTLPQATADALGGIKADAATAEDTQVVRIGTDGKLRTKPTGGSTVTVDDALSPTSENPVQNKVVTAALAGKITAPTTAAVGQIIKVKSVDGTGKPTEWEAADLPSGGGGEKQFAVIFEQLLDNSTVVSVDDDGTYNEVIIELLCPPGVAASFSKFTIFLGVGNTVNGISIANASGNNKGFWLHVTRCIDTDGVKCIQGAYMSTNMANAAPITARSGFNMHTAKVIISPIKTDLMTAGILFRSGPAIPAGSMLRISAK